MNQFASHLVRDARLIIPRIVGPLLKKILPEACPTNCGISTKTKPKQT